MTESEWLASDDPAAMLAEVDGHLRTYSTGHQEPVFKASDRKLRLFARACWGPKREWRVGDEGETPADGESLLSIDQIGSCEASALLRDIVGNPFRPWLCQRCARGPAFLHLVGDGIEFACRRCRKTSEPARSAVLDLANAAYAHRDTQTGHLEPDRLAILADALEEAGCDDWEMMGHLRGREWCKAYAREGGRHAQACLCKPPAGRLPNESPHVRGCWAIDLILGKE